MRELGRFANREYWAWFSLVFLFFLLSGAIVATYWWNHYSEDLVGKQKPQRSNQVKVYGFSKDDVKRAIRSVGTVCAVFQLGTAFAALRALFSAQTRQRLVAMDLRGEWNGIQNPLHRRMFAADTSAESTLQILRGVLYMVAKQHTLHFPEFPFNKVAVKY